MGSAFAQGFQMGGSMYDAAERNRLMRERMDIEKAQEARAAEEHGLRITGLRRVEDATQSLTNMQANGIAIPGAAEGNRQANMESLRRFEIGQQNDDPNASYVAPTGLQPTYRPATDRDLNNAQMGLAAAKGDMAAMATLTQARRTLDINDIASKVMKMPKADLEALAPQVSKSGYPMLYTGKDKNGYTFLKTEADGVTPIAGSQFTLNENQLRQMALSHELGTAGFGTEALATLNAAHKDLGDHVSKWNAAMTQSTTTNNTAVHNANTDQTQRITANAAAANAASNTALRTEQIRGLQDLRENREEAVGLMERFDALTPEQQSGPEGQALIQRFNTLNVRAGGTVGLQGKGGKGSGRGSLLQMPVEQKKNDDGTYTAFAKDGGQALYNTINGEAIPLGMDAPTYAAHKKAAKDNGVKLIVGENNGRLELRFQGVDGQFYEDPAQARYAKGDAPPSAAKSGGLRMPGNDVPVSNPGSITVSINPQTKQRTYAVEGLRKRFATMEEAQAASGSVGGSDMSRMLNRYGD